MPLLPSVLSNEDAKILLESALHKKNLGKNSHIFADTVLVTHCMMGGRAGKAAAALKEMGFAKVYNYKGSFKDWVAKGGAVEK